MPPAPRSFFQRDTVTLARALLGQKLVRIVNGKRLAGVIVETEAYLGVRDRAAHTYGGRRTPRNEVMWGEAGHGYIYFTYGMHHCFNVVARGPELPEAVLVRALEPVEGVERIRRNRPAARRDSDLCSGPAKLCQALRIDRTLNGVDLTRRGPLFIERIRSRAWPSRQITVSKRIGVDYAGPWADKPLRFHFTGNAHVSRR